jgi:hypothetical protein
MPAPGFEPVFLAIERPQTCASDRTANGIVIRVDFRCVNRFKIIWHLNSWKKTNWLSKPQSLNNVCNKCVPLYGATQVLLQMHYRRQFVWASQPTYYWVYILTGRIRTYHKQMENKEYFSYLCSLGTIDARCTNEIELVIFLATFNSKIDLNIRRKLVKFYIRSISFYGVNNWHFGK